MSEKTISRWLVLPVALAALAVGGVPATAHADAPDPFKVLVNAFGVAHRAAPTTMLVGDSLVLNLDAQAMADHMTKVTGRSTAVAASAGASTKNFVTRWLASRPRVGWTSPNDHRELQRLPQGGHHHHRTRQQ